MGLLTEGVETRWDDDRRGLVVQDNMLVRAAYTMPLNTKRLLMLAMSKINSEQFPGKKEILGVTITAEDWSSTYSTERQWRELKAATQDLMRRQVVFNPMAKDKWTKRVVNFCDSADYYDGLGMCEIRFSRTVTVMLSGMLDEFTKLDLLNVSKFTSKHSVRLYELLSQMRTPGKTHWWLKINIDEFRVCMGFTDKQYARLTELRRAVLLPAVDEINKKSDITVGVEPIKQGRKIVGLYFQYKENDQLNLFID